MKRFFIIRHGETLFQRDKSSWEKYTDDKMPLTKVGIKQAKECGEWLKNNLGDGKTKIYASPYKRAEETSKIIHDIVNPDSEISFENNIREQSFGIFTGYDTPQCWEKFPELAKEFDEDSKKYGRFSARFHQGESREDVYNRAKITLSKAKIEANKNDIENIVIVAHSITNRALLMSLLNKDGQWFDKQTHMSNCSVRVLDYSDNKITDKGYLFTPKTLSADALGINNLNKGMKGKENG